MLFQLRRLFMQERALSSVGHHTVVTLTRPAKVGPFCHCSMSGRRLRNMIGRLRA